MDEIELLQRACAQVEAQVEAAAACADKPSPCTEWNAGQLAAHVVNSLRFNTSLLLGTPPTSGPFDTPEISPGDLLSEFQQATTGLVEAATAPGALERMVDHPAGQMPAAQMLIFPTFDAYVHAWDLEQVTGLGQEFPEDLTGAINGFCQQAFSGERNPDVMKEAVDAPDGADSMTRLAAFLGRSMA